MKKAITGLTTIDSNLNPAQTVDRVQKAIRSERLTIFSVVDHAVGATDVGLSLRPTTLIIFGNARGGTPLMQSVQTVGIDLPLKILVWEDEKGKTWISHNEPTWIAQRHGVTDGEPAVRRMSDLVREITTTAAAS